MKHYIYVLLLKFCNETFWSKFDSSNYHIMCRPKYLFTHTFASYMLRRIMRHSISTLDVPAGYPFALNKCHIEHSICSPIICYVSYNLSPVTSAFYCMYRFGLPGK